MPSLSRPDRNATNGTTGTHDSFTHGISADVTEKYTKNDPNLMDEKQTVCGAIGDFLLRFNLLIGLILFVVT